MKVLIVSPTHPDPHCGISTYTGYLVQELGKLVDVKIIGADTPAFVRETVRAAQEADLVHIQHAFSNFGYLGYRSFGLYPSLRRTGKPIVTTVHELPMFEISTLKDKLAHRYFKYLLQYMVSASDLVWVHTENNVQELDRLGIHGNIQTIAHGTIQAKLETRKHSMLQENGVIGFFGFIAEHKQIHLILEALAQLPAIRLRIAGTPKDAAGQAYLERLQEQTHELGLGDRVEFMGYVPDNEMERFFASVDLVVFPYNHGTASGAFHLAMAHQAVIIASNIPLFEEAKAVFDCLETFERDNPNSLAQQIKYLLADEKRRSELMAGCERMIEATGWASIARQTATTYRNLVETFEHSRLDAHLGKETA